MSIKLEVQYYLSEAWELLKAIAQIATVFLVLWLLVGLVEHWTTYEGRTAEEWSVHYDDTRGCVEYSDNWEDAKDCF